MPTELKSTINLPKTEFAMKAESAAERAENARPVGGACDIYERIREARKGKPSYVLHDGPPYANGPIHLGHALNKCLKDFVVKSKTMAGFDAPYVPGWDCHGLPIEIKVDEQLGRKKLRDGSARGAAACREVRREVSRSPARAVQTARRVRALGRSVFDHDAAVRVGGAATSFTTFWRTEFVYKGLRSVYWCIHDKTALAEAEVEYEMHTSPSVWVIYRADERSGRDRRCARGQKSRDDHLDDDTVDAAGFDGSGVSSRCGVRRARTWRTSLHRRGRTGARRRRNDRPQNAQEIARFPGRKLESRDVPASVPRSQDPRCAGRLRHHGPGTGAVHTAPSHGADDFYTGVKYKIDQTCNVDEGGRIRNGLARIRWSTGLQSQSSRSSNC